MSKSKPKAQLALVKAVGNTAQPSPKKSIAPSFFHKVIKIPNPEQVASVTVEQAAAEFDYKNPNFHQKNLMKDELDRRYEESEKHQQKLEDDVKAIDPKIKSCKQHVDTDKDVIHFKDWTLLDRFMAILIAIAGLACLIMSGANVYSNLISSGEPIYINSPWIPIFISLLAPSCSIAIKFLGSLFEYNYFYKRCFTNLTFIASTVSFLVWVFLFSQSYSVASGIDWDSLGESDNGLGTWLSFMQLLTEILIGGALFLALNDIFLKYSPDYYQDNIHYLNAVKLRDEHLKEHEALRQERNQNHTELAVLSAQRQAYINEKLVDVIDRKSRQNALNDL